MSFINRKAAPSSGFSIYGLRRNYIDKQTAICYHKFSVQTVIIKKLSKNRERLREDRRYYET